MFQNLLLLKSIQCVDNKLYLYWNEFHDDLLCVPNFIGFRFLNFFNPSDNKYLN